MPFVWIEPPERAFAALYDDYTQRVFWSVYALCVRRAPEATNWMKDNARWTDRTGNARQTLWTNVTGDGLTIVITLSHGMWYGWWLEVAHTGRYAIVAPAVDYWAVQLMQDIQGLFR